MAHSLISRSFLLRVRRFDAAQHMNSEWRLLGPTVAFGAACALTVTSRGPLPELWHLMLAILLLLGAGAWHRRLSDVVFQAVVAALFGVFLTVVRIASFDVEPLRKEAFYDFTGTITKIEDRMDRPLRLTIKPSHFHRGRPFKGLARINVKGSTPGDIVVGSYVRLAARLGPSSGPVTPGGFDFSRRAFFLGLAGEGFAVGDLSTLSATADRGIQSWIEQVRLDTAATIRAHLPGENGAVAVAILVGYKHFLSQETADAFRHTGLAHLMAISGLHVGLVAAAAFFVLELVLAAIPALALRRTPRKPAAVGAWVIAGGYVLLSGMGVSTIRAFLMVSIAMLALLCDRRVFTIRSVMLAAIVILMIWPESIISAGFQMSFAATAALVVVYDRLGRAGLVWSNAKSWPMKLLQVFLYSALTTVIAELAIAPFALYHFQGTSLVGLGSNTVVIPIFSLIVMPFGLLSLLLMPIGLEALPLAIAGFGLDVILDIAHWFADLEFAVGYIPLVAGTFIVAAAALFLSFIAIEGRLQFLPLAIALILLPGMGSAPSEDILIDNEGRVVAALIASSDAGYAIVGGRRGGFRDNNWARYWGKDPDDTPDTLLRRCDTSGCLIHMPHKDYLIAYVNDMAALRRSCTDADLVVIPQRWRRYCRGRSMVLTREEIDRRGPVGIDSTSGTVIWSRQLGYMPWQIKPSSNNRFASKGQ